MYKGGEAEEASLKHTSPLPPLSPCWEERKQAAFPLCPALLSPLSLSSEKRGLLWKNKQEVTVVVGHWRIVTWRRKKGGRQEEETNASYYLSLPAEAM